MNLDRNNVKFEVFLDIKGKGKEVRVEDSSAKAWLSRIFVFDQYFPVSKESFIVSTLGLCDWNDGNQRPKSSSGHGNGKCERAKENWWKIIEFVFRQSFVWLAKPKKIDNCWGKSTNKNSFVNFRENPQMNLIGRIKSIGNFLVFLYFSRAINNDKW